MSEERTFDATPRRREEARRQGKTPRGTDVTAAAVILTAILLLLFGGARLAGVLGDDLRHTLDTAPTVVASTEELTTIAQSSILRLIFFSAPVVLLFWAVAVVSQVGQVGWNLDFSRVVPDFSRIHPATGMTRLANSQKWLDGGLVMFRIASSVIVACGALWIGRNGFASHAIPGGGILDVATNATWVLLYLAVTLSVIAVFEFGLRWWQFENSLKMTPEEAREEMREQEGDLRVRALRRGSHQQLIRKGSEAMAERNNDQAAADSRE